MNISELYGKHIYSLAGEFKGTVLDVVLNIRTGKVSKLRVSSYEEVKNVKPLDILKNTLSGGISDDGTDPQVKSEEKTIINYENVIAIKDIVLVEAEIRKPENPKNTVQKNPKNTVQNIHNQ
jgi:sporulation protein YlmC with PRC-barrel domain